MAHLRVGGSVCPTSDYRLNCRRHFLGSDHRALKESIHHETKGIVRPFVLLLPNNAWCTSTGA